VPFVFKITAFQGLSIGTERMFIQGTLAREFGSVCRYTAVSDQTVCSKLRLFSATLLSLYQVK